MATYEQLIQQEASRRFPAHQMPTEFVGDAIAVFEHQIWDRGLREFLLDRRQSQYLEMIRSGEEAEVLDELLDLLRWGCPGVDNLDRVQLAVELALEVPEDEPVEGLLCELDEWVRTHDGPGARGMPGIAGRPDISL